MFFFSMKYGVWKRYWNPSLESQGQFVGAGENKASKKLSVKGLQGKKKLTAPGSLRLEHSRSPLDILSGNPTNPVTFFNV